MGVEGRIFPVGSKPADAGALNADDWFPIQVKQMDNVGRREIDVFEAVMLREGEGGRQRGFSMAFGCSCDAECAAFYARPKRPSSFSPCRRFLSEEHVQKVSNDLNPGRGKMRQLRLESLFAAEPPLTLAARQFRG